MVELFMMPRPPSSTTSGHFSLGDVPEHWEVESLRAAAELFVEKNRPDLPVLSVYREYGVIPKDSRDDNHNATSLDTSSYKVVQPGDLAVNKMKAWQGSLGVSEHHGIVSPAYITCRLNQKKVSGRYIHYLLRSRTLVGALDSISYGVRVGQWDMRFEDFKKIGITIPPKPEQDRIVTFLDRKTAEIDALIAKKQRQIELLDEQKAILINRAVTRGINPNAKLKPSGIEWIGDVPEHWEVESLRAAAELFVEKNRPDLPVLSVYREYGVIPKDSRDDNHNATSLDTSSYKVVQPGDLAVNKMKAWQGSLGVSEHHGIVSPAYITCRLNQKKVSGRYIHYLLRPRTLVGALDSISYGVRVGQWDMRFEDFKKVGITIPPKPEQDRIVTFLDRKTAEIDALIAKKQRQIELLDEQKVILIAHAVTGRIKV